ncbi:helix-turn-helix domain-containing protein [Pseudogemmobacter blasticus]|uniref:Chromosomal replication initiator DnaA C-terminal domain-containing protein n=1 Tax=Fuscovulum blasticum DSM 2131 TaxID=1188250 RepID=A0A2T4JDQ7_FUSBL|nr:helix-turn-helix domain-containing protein [Fuscovulum blasticum]PTE15958.1 hypothetical protein C5F44_02655 [Fuscovulum blasticum DSM 2131]
MMPATATAPAAPGFMAPADVLASFCAIAAVPMHELCGPGQTRGVSRLRHECMWLMRDLTAAASTQIGDLLGGRHQATVDEAAAKIADRLATDPEYRDRLRQLRAEIIAWVGAAPGLPSPLRITAAVGVLQDASLADADARAAALTLLGGSSHGA